MEPPSQTAFRSLNKWKKGESNAKEREKRNLALGLHMGICNVGLYKP